VGLLARDGRAPVRRSRALNAGPAELRSERQLGTLPLPEVTLPSAPLGAKLSGVHSADDKSENSAGWRLTQHELAEREQARERALHEPPPDPPVKLSSVALPVGLAAVFGLVGFVVGVLLAGNDGWGLGDLVVGLALLSAIVGFLLGFLVRFVLGRSSKSERNSR
jgi:hypothetical protein